MSRQRSWVSFLVGVFLVVPGLADDPPASAWSDKAELSLVATSGNSEARTFGFKNVLKRSWQDDSELTLDVSALRAESTKIGRRAVGQSPEEFELVEERRRETTADRSRVLARYDHRLTDALQWFVSAAWQRDEPSGIDRRATAVGGVALELIDRESAKLSFDLGLTFTSQRTTGGAADDFLGLRLASDAMRRLTATTVYTNVLTIDENLDDLADLRATMEQALAVSMTDRLAIKLALTMFWDGQPALVPLPLELSDGGASGPTVEVPLDELDSELTVALVVSF